MIFNGKNVETDNNKKISCSCSLRCASLYGRMWNGKTLISYEDFFFRSGAFSIKKFIVWHFSQRLQKKNVLHIFNCSVYALFIENFYYYYLRRVLCFYLKIIIYWSRTGLPNGIVQIFPEIFRYSNFNQKTKQNKKIEYLIRSAIIRQSSDQFSSLL